MARGLLVKREDGYSILCIQRGENESQAGQYFKTLGIKEGDMRTVEFDKGLLPPQDKPYRETYPFHEKLKEFLHIEKKLFVID
jgi:hypothetical protein